MAINDFTGQNIQDTYQRVVQTDGTNRLADGTGSIFIPVSSSHAITASHALFAVSASHEITFEVSSSHAINADTASFATNFTASGDISASGNILANGYKVDGYNGLTSDSTTLQVGNANYWDKIRYGREPSDQHLFLGNVTASGTISSSKTISGLQYVANGVGVLAALANLAGTNTVIVGNGNDFTEIDGTNIKLDAPVTASGNISSSGTLTANKLKLGELSAIFVNNGGYKFGQTPVPIHTNHITASGNISASGTIIAKEIDVRGHITASSNISASGDLIANNATINEGYVTVTGSSTSHGFQLSRDGLDTYKIRHLDGGLTIQNSSDSRKEMTFDGTGKVGIGNNDPQEILTVEGNISASGNVIINEITASGNISSSGTFIGNEFNFGRANDKILQINGGIAIKSAESRILLTGNVTASANISASGTVFADKLHLKTSTTPGPIIQLENDSGGSGADSFIRFGDSSENYSYALGADDSGNSFRIAYNGSAFDGAVLGTNDVLAIDTVGNITASGNISSSGGVNANKYEVRNQTIIDYDGSIGTRIGIFDQKNIIRGRASFEGHVTASKNISSSGNIDANQYKSNGQTFAQFVSDIVQIGGGVQKPATFSGTTIKLGTTATQHVTASGNISASGTSHILGGDLTIGDDFTFGIHKLATHASGVFNLISGSTSILSAQGNHVTASGNISSSGTITALKLHARDTDSSAGIALFDADGNGIANLARVGSGDNAHRGRMVLRDNANIKVQITTNGDSYLNGINPQLGIGTDSPSNTLHVVGDAKINSHITASGNISASATSFIQTPVIKGTGTGTAQLDVQGQITASGNISSSNDIIANRFVGTIATAAQPNITSLGTLTTLTAGTLRLTSTTDASATSTGHAFQSGLTSGANIIINSNEVMARNNGAVAALYLNPDGGMVAFQNSEANSVQIDHGHITASGNISASGTNHTLGGDLTIKDDLIVDGGNVTINGGNVADSILKLATNTAGASDDVIIELVTDEDGTPRQARIGVDHSDNTLKLVHGSGFSGGTNGICVDSGGKVGIGTATPGEKLEVVGNISASGEIQALNMKINGQRLTINDDNLTLPDTGLTVAGPITASGNISASGTIISTGNITSEGTTLTLQNASSPKLVIKDTSNNFATEIEQTNTVTNFRFNDNAAQDAHFISNTDAHHIVLDGGTGRVGIGEVSPASKLEVDGDFTATNITASGNIKASGNIITDKIVGGTYSSDSLLNLHDDNVVNANGVTLSSIGSMVFMLDSNDTGDVDKFEFRADSQDASAGNLLATIEDNGDFTVEGNITASKNISASGTIITNEISCSTAIESTLYTIDGQNAIDFAADTHLFGNVAKFSKLRTQKGLEITAPVTASSHISASGTVEASGYKGTPIVLARASQVIGTTVANQYYYGNDTQGFFHHQHNAKEPVGSFANATSSNETNHKLGQGSQHNAVLLPCDVKDIELRASCRPNHDAGGAAEGGFAFWILKSTRASQNPSNPSLIFLASASCENGGQPAANQHNRFHTADITGNHSFKSNMTASANEQLFVFFQPYYGASSVNTKYYWTLSARTNE